MHSKQNQNYKEPKRYLVFRFSSLGDVALTVPVIHAVLEQNPNVSIDFVTPNFMHALFPKHERLQLFDFDKNHKNKGLRGLFKLLNSLDLERYNAIIDLHDVLRTQVLVTIAKLKLKKVVTINKDRKSRKQLIQGTTSQALKHTTEKYADTFRKIGLSVHLKHELQDFLHFETEKKQIIGVAPFAQHQGKMYAIDKMRRVVEKLSEKNSVLVFGSDDELDSIKNWKSIANVSLIQDVDLSKELKSMSELKCMISMDSANMHLASLVGVPVVSIWGVTHPKAGFLGYGQTLENVIQDESLTWRPTSIYGNKLGPTENPNGMKNIPPNAIILKVEEILNP